MWVWIQQIAETHCNDFWQFFAIVYHWVFQCTDTSVLYCCAIYFLLLDLHQWQSCGNRVSNLNKTIWLPLIWSIKHLESSKGSRLTNKCGPLCLALGHWAVTRAFAQPKSYTFQTGYWHRKDCCRSRDTLNSHSLDCAENKLAPSGPSLLNSCFCRKLKQLWSLLDKAPSS